MTQPNGYPDLSRVLLTEPAAIGPIEAVSSKIWMEQQGGATPASAEPVSRPNTIDYPGENGGSVIGLRRLRAAGDIRSLPVVEETGVVLDQVQGTPISFEPAVKKSTRPLPRGGATRFHPDPAKLES